MGAFMRGTSGLIPRARGQDAKLPPPRPGFFGLIADDYEWHMGSSLCACARHTAHSRFPTYRG